MTRSRLQIVWLCAVCGVIAVGWFSYRRIFFDRAYWPNGQLKEMARRQLIGDFLNGQRPLCGAAWSWYEDGHKEFVGHYDDYGKMDGLQRTYAEDGSTLDSWSYVHGQPVAGTRISKWPNGRIRESLTYDDNGQWNGRVLRLSPDGKVMMDWYYTNGKPKDGERKIFSVNGSIVSDVVFTNGEYSSIMTFRNSGILNESFVIDHHGQSVMKVYGAYGVGNNVTTYKFYKDEDQISSTIADLEDQIGEK